MNLLIEFTDHRNTTFNSKGMKFYMRFLNRQGKLLDAVFSIVIFETYDRYRRHEQIVSSLKESVNI